MDKLKKTLKKTYILGLGGGGINVLHHLKRIRNSENIKLIAVDTDDSTLENIPFANTIPAKLNWTDGLGCGGDIMKGERCLSNVRSEIYESLKEAEIIIVAAGLSGGTSSGGLPIISSILKKLKVPKIFIVTSPFKFEGQQKSIIAENTLQNMMPSGELIINLHNDLLYSSLASETPIEEAFQKVNSELSHTILGLIKLFSCSQIISSDYSCFRRILQNKKNTCSIGIGKAEKDEGLNRSYLVLERMLNSAFLGGIRRIEKADAAVISVSGGKDLEIGEAKKILETVQKHLNKKAQIISGISHDESFGSSIQLTLLTVNYDESDKAEKEKIFDISVHKRISEKQKSHLSQPEFDMLEMSKGIFENDEHNYHNGIDLDIPTFQRLGQIIDPGE